MFSQIDWSGVTQAITAIGVAVIGIFVALGKWSQDEHARKLELLREESSKTADRLVSVQETSEKNTQHIAKVEEHTNSMKDQLVSVTKLAALAEGELIGMAKQKEEAKIDAKDVRDQIKEATGTLAKVEATGEDTNKVVKDIATNGAKEHSA